MVDLLFPSFGNIACSPLNINELAARYLAKNPNTDSRSFLNAQFVDALIATYHKEYDIHWSYGGYLEDRSVLLKESYLKESQQFVHLGIDVNVPAGTPVASGIAGKVLVVDNDKDPHCGWGPRVVVQALTAPHEHLAVILAHLQEVQVQAGALLEPGTIIAEIGSAPENGNWFEHLHIQTVLLSYLDSQAHWQSVLDGYGHPSKLEALKTIFPDPTWILAAHLDPKSRKAPSVL